jgi:signal transduction histidine kinase
MISFHNLTTALLWSAVAALAVWLLLMPLRRRSLAWLLISVVLTGTAASVGALLGGVHSMLLPDRHVVTIIALSALAGGIATLAAAAAARRLTRENATLTKALSELRAGRVPNGDGPRLTRELQVLQEDLHRTATALNETRERERALEASRRELVSWVSHDLRTPLAGLRAMAEALEDGVAEDPALYVKQIGAAVDRLSALVDDLFDLSRLQAGSFARDVEYFSAADLISDCFAALRPLADAKDIQLSCVTSLQHTGVRGSVSELNRAFTNLVANAIRHTDLGGQVRVGLGYRDNMVVVGVRDQCGGIPEADLPRVFDVGFRGEAARSPGSGDAGAGLGLAITRAIVQAHGGTVDARNVDGGCSFTVRLPAASPES